MRFVSEIGIAPEGRMRTVGFDLTRGVVVINTDEATYAAPAAGLWSDYADKRGADQAPECPADQVPGRANRVGCARLRASARLMPVR
jgi:hypothetical protein